MYLPVYRVTCVGCGREFDWEATQISDVPPNYHSRTCQKVTSRRLKYSMPTKCPHPYKKTFATQELAMKKCRELDDDYMRPYRCSCGGYHIGHRPIYIKAWRRK